MPNNHPLTLPKVEDSQLVFEESLIKIQRDFLQQSPHQHYRYYSLITKKFSVVILAKTPDGSYVFNEEYRHPTGKILLSCPGGYVDEGESPIEAGKRELLEETGYQAESFEIIGSAYPYAGFTGQKIFYVKATNANWHSPPQLEVSEVLRTILKSEQELNEAIDQGAELDGTLCSALFFDSRKNRK